MAKRAKMMTPDPVSPIGEAAMPRAASGDAGITLSERLPSSFVQVQAWPDTVAKAAKVIDKLAGEGVTIMATGPGRWLIESDETGLEDSLRKALKTDAAAVTGLTHARVVITASGLKVDWVLASGIALDFANMEPGDVALTAHHGIPLTIRRLPDVADRKAYDLTVFSSYARDFWGWLERAGEEVGLAVA
ncbi:sarcosine oxidase subunit gamma [Ahrensia sp. R2A130]|uniref:sarcosine oxidase subunit gamma n=1 Tax=Ahrensia sp. R2A130 TaxID=744979 RepID=UPI0001E083E6|nr:sarcosine oxidase gamma subunit [Ahrensia sp. R2A130]EFL89229.1 sarcosine oxidase gamma subunit [Ahrensia sp. R2A130]